jgi:pyruvate dehydrogenase E1 component alpha subunit
MRCPTHFSIGQEAIAVGVCAHLERSDYVTSAHRSHAHYLAKGGDLRAMLAELYGKETGCARGKGGSMHLIDERVGFLGCVPIVGSAIPIGVGAAFGARLQGRNPLTVIFFGDAAVESGVCFEALNFAAVQKLPIAFVCENNLYSVMTPFADRQPDGRAIADLARGIGLEAVQADGQEVESVFDVAGEMLERVRAGAGPVFLEFATYRSLEHCGPLLDTQHPFRPEGEYERWAERCPVKLARESLIADGVLDGAGLASLAAGIEAEIDDAVAFAKQSPFPPREALLAGVFAD